MMLEKQIEGHTLWLTLHRPDALNALNMKMLKEIEAALEAIPSTIAIVVIQGAGEKAFSAGADIKELKAMSPADAGAFAEYGQRLFDRIEHLPVLTVAAVHGYTLGGGLELAMACDLIIATSDTMLGFPEVPQGVIPGFAGIERLERWVGRARARWLIFSGCRLTAHEAFQIGLVCHVADNTAGVIQQLRQLPICAVKMAKQVFEEGSSIEAFRTCFNHGEFKWNK